MLHVYEKVPKTNSNSYGIQELENENPFLTCPCIVTIIALPMFLRDVNGSMRQVAELVAPDIDEKRADNCRILGLGFGDYNPTKERFNRFNPSEEEIDDFVVTYLLPLVGYNSNSMELQLAMKKVGNVCFLTYCNGAETFVQIEKCFKKYLNLLNYNDTEINMILSQICVAAISGNVIKRKGTSTLTVTFGDINDCDFENPYEKLNIDDYGFIPYDSSLGFGVNGDGSHDFKRHMTGDIVLSPMIKTFLETAINNAYINSHSEVFCPITYEKMDNAFGEVQVSENRKIG